jgi:hypothetical protein
MDGRYTTVRLAPGAVYIDEDQPAKPSKPFDPRRMFAHKSSTNSGALKQVQTSHSHPQFTEM